MFIFGIINKYKMPNSKLESTFESERELKFFALKYHSIVAWVAIILNPIWVISDYFNSPLHVWDFFIFRIIVSISILITVLSKNKLTRLPEIMAQANLQIPLQLSPTNFG